MAKGNPLKLKSIKLKDGTVFDGSDVKEYRIHGETYEYTSIGEYISRSVKEHIFITIYPHDIWTKDITGLWGWTPAKPITGELEEIEYFE